MSLSLPTRQVQGIPVSPDEPSHLRWTSDGPEIQPVMPSSAGQETAAAAPTPDPASLEKASGPVTETDETRGNSSTPTDPQISLNLLLVSGHRRAMSFPENYTVARVKEMIWNSWPSDPAWKEQQPPAPSFLRLLHFGKIWMDDTCLSDIPALSKAPNPPSVVHLSIRPFAPSENDDAGKKKKQRRAKRVASGDGDILSGDDVHNSAANENSHSGCCCIVC